MSYLSDFYRQNVKPLKKDCVMLKNADHCKQRGRTAPNRALSKKKLTAIENLLDRYYSASIAHNNASMNIFKKVFNKVKAYVKEEMRIAERQKQYRQECELNLARKCAKCKSRDCLWMSGYCPN